MIISRMACKARYKLLNHDFPEVGTSENMHANSYSNPYVTHSPDEQTHRTRGFRITKGGVNYVEME